MRNAFERRRIRKFQSKEYVDSLTHGEAIYLIYLGWRYPKDSGRVEAMRECNVYERRVEVRYYDMLHKYARIGVNDVASITSPIKSKDAGYFVVRPSDLTRHEQAIIFTFKLAERYREH